MPTLEQDLERLTAERRAELSLQWADRAAKRVVRLLREEGLNGSAASLAKAPGFRTVETAKITDHIVGQLSTRLELRQLAGGTTADPDLMHTTPAHEALLRLSFAVVFGFGRPTCAEGPLRASQAGLAIAALLGEDEAELEAQTTEVRS